MLAEHAKSGVRHSYTTGGVNCIGRQRGGRGRRDVEADGAGKRKEGSEGREGGAGRERKNTNHSVSRQ
jgi:hypothetical protein